MARTVVPITNFVPNGSLVDVAGTAVDVTNGMTVTSPVFEETVIRVTNTAGAAKNVTIGSGTYPPALASGQGTLVGSVGATTGVQWFGPLESGRFLSVTHTSGTTGNLNIDFDAGTVGFVTAFHVPRNA
jgi:hypothetical protein